MVANRTEVLIVGAGPTGLTLALWLARLGVAVRIVDRSAGPGETSRAIAVQARTLEFHRQIGLVDDVLAAGIRVDEVVVHTPSGLGAHLRLEDFGRGISPYPFAFALPQDIHERILVDHLGRAGVVVERGTELAGFEQGADRVTATLRRESGQETVDAAYLCGCDGAHSTVRHTLGIGFPGGTYEQSFYVADVEGSGDVTRHGLDVNLNEHGFAITMPVRQSGSLRLIGIVPEAHSSDERLSFEAIRADVERDTRVKVDRLNWFSTYRVHHRVADRFRSDRAFLLGDAGHIHSPAGGQGMNTGMGDAVNLAWKIAAVLQGRADAVLLDSYEIERIAFARVLIDSTDQAFRIATSRSWLIGLFRRYLMPPLVATAMRTRAGSRAFFGLVSQTAIHYRTSPISRGEAGPLRGGDRLPYVAFGDGDNFAPLSALDWQMHVYGDARLDLRQAAERAGLPVHVFAWTDAAGQAGLVRDAAYLVRPDGHIGLVLPGQEPAELADYVRSIAIVTRPGGG